jgi:hypothetical protein
VALLRINSRSIYNKSLNLWNLIVTYGPDVVIGTGSRLIDEISNAEIFRVHYTTFRRGRHIHGV